MSQKVMIVCGEASGDLHGANLVKELSRFDNNLQFYGMGGAELARCGVDILFDAEKVAVVGVFEVFSHLKDILKAQRILRSHLKNERPDILILIDLPDFNLLLAKYAKKIGIPVFYYICPQVWAWRTGRVKTLKERVDTLGVILPFEEQFFKQHGLSARYVGHPLLDTVKTTLSQVEFQNTYHIEKGRKCIGLLPGSRKKEVRNLLPIFLEAANLLQKQSNEKLLFLIPKASTIRFSDLKESGLEEYSKRIEIKVIEGDRYDVMANCSCVVAASGTVTLELALLEVPMVVTYKLSSFTHFLGKLLVKLDNFSLVNLIAAREVVPELLQDEVKAEVVCNELAKILFSYDERKKMLEGLREVKRCLGTPGASLKAANLAKELLAKNSGYFEVY